MLTCLRWDLCISKGAACAVERGREQTKSACIDTKKSTATIQQGAGRCLVLRMECKTSALSSRRGGLVPCVSLALSPEGQCWPWALQSYICQMGRWGEGSDQAGLSRAHHLPKLQSPPRWWACAYLAVVARPLLVAGKVRRKAADPGL